VEKIDEKLMLHFYGRMAFLKYLLPALSQSSSSQSGESENHEGRGGGGSRVLSVLSGGIHSAYEEMFNDPELKENYSLKNAADSAGYYNDLGRSIETIRVISRGYQG